MNENNISIKDEDSPDWTHVVAGDLLPGDLINHPDTHQTVEILDVYVEDDGAMALTLSRDTLVVHADDLVQMINRRTQ